HRRLPHRRPHPIRVAGARPSVDRVQNWAIGTLTAATNSSKVQGHSRRYTVAVLTCGSVAERIRLCALLPALPMTGGEDGAGQDLHGELTGTAARSGGCAGDPVCSAASGVR